MTWLMKILKIELEEQILTKYYVIKHFSLKIQDLMDIHVDVFQWFIEKCLVVVLKLRIFKTKIKLKKYTNQLLQNLIKESILIVYKQ